MSLFLFLLAQAVVMPATPPAPSPAPSVVPPAAWTPRTRTADGGVTSTSAAVSAPDGSSRLMVKCDRGAEAVVSVQFFSRQPLQKAADDGTFADKTVALRFDDGAAHDSAWELRSNAAFTANPTATEELVTGIARAKRIKVETTNATNSRIEALFDGPASDAPVRTVLQACGYELGQPLTPQPLTSTPPAPEAK